MPKAFLSDCMQQIVQINPITYGIEGMRGLITTAFDPNKVFPAIIVVISSGARNLQIAKTRHLPLRAVQGFLVTSIRSSSLLEKTSRDGLNEHKPSKGV